MYDLDTCQYHVAVYGYFWVIYCISLYMSVVEVLCWSCYYGSSV